MINEKDDTEQRTRRTAGVMGTAAAVGVAAGVAAGALLDEATEPDEAMHAPSARDPFDDLVPPAPAATPAAAEADTPAATAEAPAVIDTDDSVNPVVTHRPTEVPDAGAATMPADPAPVVAEAPAAPAPRVETPVAPQPVADQPAAEQPVVVEEPVAVEPPVAVDEPVVVEEPVVVDPPVAEHPTEPPAVLPPFENVPIGGGLEPRDPIVLGDGTEIDLTHPIDVMPPAPVDPMPPVTGGPLDDPFAPMPPQPEHELPAPFDAPTDGFDGGGIDGGVDPNLVPVGVPGPGIEVTVPAPTTVVPPVLIEIETFDAPPVDGIQDPQVAIDLLSKAMMAVQERVELFSELDMRDIDNDDKIELWRALKQLNPTLTGGPRQLQGAVDNNWTLEKVADWFDVDIQALALSVNLENNGNLNMQEFAQHMAASHMTVDPNLMSMAIDGYQIQISSDGHVVFMDNNGPEGAFQSLSIDVTELGTGGDPTGWGVLFGPDDGGGIDAESFKAFAELIENSINETF